MHPPSQVAKPQYLHIRAVAEEQQARLKTIQSMGKPSIDVSGSGVPSTARTMNLVHDKLKFRQVVEAVEQHGEGNFKDFARIAGGVGSWIDTPEAQKRETGIVDVVQKFMVYMNPFAFKADRTTKMTLGGNPESKMGQHSAVYGGIASPGFEGRYVPMAARAVLFLVRYATVKLEHRDMFGAIPPADADLQAAAEPFLRACEAYAQDKVQYPTGGQQSEQYGRRACDALARFVGAAFFIERGCGTANIDCWEEIFLCAFCYDGEKFKDGGSIKSDAWPVIQLLRNVIHFFFIRHARGLQADGTSREEYTHPWGPPLEHLPLPTCVTTALELSAYCKGYVQEGGRSTPGANLAIVLRWAQDLSKRDATISKIIFESDPNDTGDDTVIGIGNIRLTLRAIKLAPQHAQAAARAAFGVLIQGSPTARQLCDELVETSNRGEDWGFRDQDFFDTRRGQGFHNDPRNDGLVMQQIRDKILQELAESRGLLGTSDPVSYLLVFQYFLSDAISLPLPFLLPTFPISNSLATLRRSWFQIPTIFWSAFTSSCNLATTPAVTPSFWPHVWRTMLRDGEVLSSFAVL
jgi:hypothetical protein